MSHGMNLKKTTTKMSVHLAETQISLDIWPVWLETMSLRKRVPN